MMRALILRIAGASVLCMALAAVVIAVTMPRNPVAASRPAQAALLQPQAVVTYFAPSPTPIPQPPTPRPLPTATAQPTPLPPVAGLTAIPQSDLPLYSKISGWKFERQAFNNCGPAALSMLLNFHNVKGDQYSVAKSLRPTSDDRNVTPEEMAVYAEQQGLRSFFGAGGDLMMLRQFAANNIPVMVEMWFTTAEGDEMGHYAIVMGHGPNEIVTYDSYRGPNSARPPAEFDALWRVFNRDYLVVYKQEQESIVRGILGYRLDKRKMYENALEISRNEAQLYNDNFSWFNVGTNAVRLGNNALAVEAYDKARAKGWPFRMLWYQYGIYEAYYNAGRNDDVIALASDTLARADNLEENFYWRGRAWLAKGDIARGQAELQTAVRYRPTFGAAQQALGR